LLGSGLTGPLTPVHSQRFHYPDNFHNAEELAVTGEWIYILTKEPLNNGKRSESYVYRIPISLSAGDDSVAAEFVTRLKLPAASIESSLIASLGGVDISQPTAFDIDEQNRYAYMLTYRSVFRFERGANEQWRSTLSNAGRKIHSHSLAQAEALAVDANGIVWFTTEKRPAPLWALPAAEQN